ncbi:uncharacterized mitochondrial protein AtMg00810-like [Malus domestica]|uniref:uncharacterized mitochondrial protein AtMg00810-like n=1 Tax=Malus domestica TaxID=3750 RepID=UPI0039760C2A
MAVNNAWALFQIDVKNAFLHGDLEEEVYMKLPPGHPRENEPNKVCRLHKAIYGDNISEIKTLKQSLHKKFAIKDLGPLKYFLGIEVATSSKELFLNQRKYVLNLLDEANMMECKLALTPLASKLQWHEKVSLANQFMHSPTLVHWEIVKRILRYLKGSVGRGIIMKNNGSNHILAYTDADWAGNALDRKSTTGFCTFVGGNLVTWKSKKQTVIA